MRRSNNRPLSEYKIKKNIMAFYSRCYSYQTSKLLNINRNTINRYYNIFRKIIYCYQIERFKKVVGLVELDESYFYKCGFLSVTELYKKKT